MNLTSTRPEDLAVFVVLETLGICGLFGNSLLIIIICRYGYLQKPSFIFISSLAVADLIHSIVTSIYFHPPILLRYNHFPYVMYRIWNTIDWTAWGITLTHMIAISIDRVLAVLLLNQYSTMVTVRKCVTLTVVSWTLLVVTNVALSAMEVCCPIVPLPEYYTFAYAQPKNATISTNIYQSLYIPLEVATIVILAVSTPITVTRLYQRYRRKLNLKQAGDVLAEIGQNLARGGHKLPMDASTIREFKIFAQIITVTVIFFVYMFNYYLFFYIVGMVGKWVTMFNSLFYSVTHMINPIVYLLLNEQMRVNFADFTGKIERKLLQAIPPRLFTKTQPVDSSTEGAANECFSPISQLSPIPTPLMGQGELGLLNGEADPLLKKRSGGKESMSLASSPEMSARLYFNPIFIYPMESDVFL